MTPIRKYPRTQHLVGSGLQPGDEDLDAVPMAALVGRHVVVEEKMDGANCGASFGPDLALVLQSRGHYLQGGPREKQFALFKQWAAALADRLLDRLEARYVMYGEWLYAKHSVYYDALPHYFMEFDALDTVTGAFLDTPRRAELLAGLPVTPVKVLYAGEFPGEAALRALIGPSHFITADAPTRFREEVARLDWDVERAVRQTDLSGQMEGLYVKVEEGGAVTERYKFVRPEFLQTVTADGHWQDRPLVPNRLADGAELFGE
ncbi:RNA ligase family protein [Gemmata sp.]|uniref:RNA ligase family protein n=1 Tax=Gemmata sp. TaxID=1914242 RepID=UPI003F729CA2